VIVIIHWPGKIGYQLPRTAREIEKDGLAASPFIPSLRLITTMDATGKECAPEQNERQTQSSWI